MIGGKFMNYTFTNKRDYIKFLSNLREGVVGIQSTIYFDDRNNKAIKIFSWKIKILIVGRKKQNSRS